MQKNMIVTIFGGTGFIGSHVIRELAKDGYIIRVAERSPKRADTVKFNGQVGQIVPVACDYSQKSINAALDGASIAINCTGILLEKGHRSFMGTHCYIPEMIAKACEKNNLDQFIHISALGIDENQSDYAKSKLTGEHKIQKLFDKTTYLRPSIVFGPEDNFFNMFASMAKISPALPLIGGGKTLFQPVYVGDIALAVSQSIKQKIFGVIECGGPEILSFKGLLQKMKNITGQKACLIPMPYWMAQIQAVVMSILPTPPLTLDQIKSLKHDNILTDDALNLSNLGIKLTSMDAVLPRYLGRFKQ